MSGLYTESRRVFILQFVQRGSKHDRATMSSSHWQCSVIGQHYIYLLVSHRSVWNPVCLQFGLYRNYTALFASVCLTSHVIVSYPSLTERTSLMGPDLSLQELSRIFSHTHTTIKIFRHEALHAHHCCSDTRFDQHSGSWLFRSLWQLSEWWGRQNWMRRRNGDVRLALCTWPLE